MRSRAIGRTLVIPIGNETTRITITPGMASIRVSLRTRDPSEAKVRQAKVVAYLESVWRALRSTAPVTLTYRQATALAGRLYRAWANGEGRERTIAITWTGSEWVPDRVSPEEEAAGFGSAQDRLRATLEANPDDLEPALGPLLDRLLLAEGIAELDPECRTMVLGAFALALVDAFARREREAEGDYRPDPKSERFPEWQAPKSPVESPPAPRGKQSLTGLVGEWWREAQATGRKRSTYESYRNSMAALVAFLKHDDASRVTPEDLIRFKDYRLASINPRTGKPISPKTVKDSDLAGLKTVFGNAVTNRRMATNPAAGLTIKVGKRPKLRSKGFTDEEARALLRAALTHKAGSEQPRTAAAKRWVPWLCAYTGARVGELAQLRKQDLRREGEHWVVTITPEAGTVKTNEARDVVLHPHLAELRFPEFVAGAPAGHLFLKPGKAGDVRGPLRGLKNRLAEFAREVVPDPNVAPNHGWRHRFKTVGMEAGIAPRVLDAIQGQAPRSVADTYGDVTVRTMAQAMARLPRIEVEVKQ